jgi:hypothetical protein
VREEPLALEDSCLQLQLSRPEESLSPASYINYIIRR